MSCLTFSFLLFLTCIFICAHKCICFRAKLGARTRAKLSSLSSLLSFTSVKILTSLAFNLLLYLLLPVAGHLHEVEVIADGSPSVVESCGANWS